MKAKRLIAHSTEEHKSISQRKCELQGKTKYK